MQEVGERRCEATPSSSAGETSSLPASRAQACRRWASAAAKRRHRARQARRAACLRAEPKHAGGGRAPLRSGGGELGRRDEQLAGEPSPSMQEVGERRCEAAAASSAGETSSLPASRARACRRWASAAAKRRRRARQARRAACRRAEPKHAGGGRAPLRSDGGELGRRDEQLACEPSPSMQEVGERRCEAAAASSAGETSSLPASRARACRRWASAVAKRRRRARQARRAACLRAEPEHERSSPGISSLRPC